MSQAMPIVTNTNEMPAKANPTTYQMPVNRTPFERRAGSAPLTEDSLRRAQPQATGRASLQAQFYQWERKARRTGDGVRRGEGWVGERCASSARAGRAPLPVLVVPDRCEDCRAVVIALNRAFALVG